MENIAMPMRTPFVSQRLMWKWITGIICGALLVG